MVTIPEDPKDHFNQEVLHLITLPLLNKIDLRGLSTTNVLWRGLEGNLVQPLYPPPPRPGLRLSRGQECRGQLSDILHRASVWRTVSCNAVLNLPHVSFLFDATKNIVDIDKFAQKISSVTFFSGTKEASFLIFGTEHQYEELYRVTQFLIYRMSTSCLTRLWILWT